MLKNYRFSKVVRLKKWGTSFEVCASIPDTKERKRYDLFKEISIKIFSQLVDKIEVFEDKTINIVFKIDDDLNKIFEENSIDFSNFSLVLPQKTAKFDEKVTKNEQIKNSPRNKNAKRVETTQEDKSTDSLSTNWPPRQESNPQPFGS